MTAQDIAKEAERMAASPQEHNLSDAFRLIAALAKLLEKRKPGRPRKPE